MQCGVKMQKKKTYVIRKSDFLFYKINYEVCRTIKLIDR